METLEDYLFTKNIKWVLWGAVGLTGAALIFHAGVVAGSHNTLTLKRGMPGIQSGGFEAHIPFGGAVTMPQGFMPGGHGALGTISAIALPTLTLISRDGTTLRVEVSSSTQIAGAVGTTTGTLKVGDTIIVVGDPNDTDEKGEVDARLIRVLPH